MWLQVTELSHNPAEVLRYCGPSSVCEYLCLLLGKPELHCPFKRETASVIIKVSMAAG